MPDIEYNTFHPAAVKDNEEGTLLPPSLSGTTTSAGGEEEAETKIAAVLSPSKKIGFGILFVGLMTIVVTAISKNNTGNLRTSVTELPMYGDGDSCCVPATGTFSGSAADNKNPPNPLASSTDPFEACWQAYEGQYCWTKSYYEGGFFDAIIGGSDWFACEPEGPSWNLVIRAPGNTCSDPCQTFARNACKN